MPSYPQRLQVAVDHLLQTDSVLRDIVQRVGPCRLRPARDRFAMLVRSIVSQQVSSSAAKAIYGRLSERVGPAGLTPRGISKLPLDELRSVGVSRQKAEYLLDLARRTRAGQVRLERFGRMPDESIIDELVQVKGIGRWTAQMLLIFSMGRLDVLPVDDFGIRSAIRAHYGFAELPRPAEIHTVAEPWRPYASVACWYLWRSLDG